MQLHAAVVRAGQTAPAQHAGGHSKIPTVFLHHHIGRDFGGTEERVLALINRESLRNAMFVSRIGIIPASLEFTERDGIRGVSVDFVRAHVNERAFGTSLPRGLEEVERADSIGVEVVERDRRRAIVAGLGRRVHDDGRPHFLHQREHAGAVGYGMSEYLDQIIDDAPVGIAE